MKALVQDIVKTLKVTERQASGGAAVLLKAAQDKLGAAQFGSLLGTVPGIDALIARAPPTSSASRLFGGLASALGGNAPLIASIVGGFSRLGLSADHAQQFVPVILAHLRGVAGKDAVDKLERTLRDRIGG